MNAEIKQLWVDALRSGDYTQGQGGLKTATGYCCLGVLCELHRIHTGQGEWIGQGEYANRIYRSNSEEVSIFLGEEVYSWAGTNSNPDVKCFNGVYSLSTLNDGQVLDINGVQDFRQLKFNQIADLIEEQL